MSLYCINYALQNSPDCPSSSYDRTPPCSEVATVTQCSQHFHEVQIRGLKQDTTYYYKIQASNGTTASDILKFTTARAAGDKKGFSIAVLNDMGYTNAGGTFNQLTKAIDNGVAFAWHGGDISYADDWYSGLLPCEDSWPVCYNGSSTRLPGGKTPEYDVPLPAGEVASQGGPRGGDMSVIYESNWDLWQQWMTNISSKVPYMVLPGNHEAACAEFDYPDNPLATYLNLNKTNSTSSSKLNYFSCPPSQRNYTAYQNRFRMPGAESKGVSNFWYSFDYGLAHFIAFNGETDYPNSPEAPFAKHLKNGATKISPNQTFSTDSGPFGAVNGDINVKESYEQYKWLKDDLAKVDRKKTPWVIAMSHRPMYSSQVSGYQNSMRAAFEELFLKNGVDAYLSGHIHWYERIFPIGHNGTVDMSSVVNNNTYWTNPGTSMTHIINGMAGNIESHATLAPGKNILNISAVLDWSHYGFSKLNVINETVLTWNFIKGSDGKSGDDFTLIKRPTDAPSSIVPHKTVTETVTAYTTYCPIPTTFVQNSKTYTVTEPTTLTITDCPCTVVKTLPAGNGTAVATATGSNNNGGSGSKTTGATPSGPSKTPGGSTAGAATMGVSAVAGLVAVMALVAQL